MKPSATVLALLIAFSNVSLADSTITSEQDLKEEVARLQDPETQISALERLVKFSGIFLYESSVRWISGDREMDNLRRSARKALQDRRDPEIVKLALTHKERDVRFWGVMSVETANGRRDPWKLILPILQTIAVEDSDSNIRAEAIRRIEAYDMDFIRELRSDTMEASPWVLMNLLGFESGMPELRAQFYERAVHYLSDEDADVRTDWLSYLQLNACLSSIAEMWRIESNPSLVAKLREIGELGSPTGQALATTTLSALSVQEQRKTQQNAAGQPATRALSK